MEYLFTGVFVLDFLEVGFLLMPGKVPQLFKKNNIKIVVMNFFVKQIMQDN